jgi:hypothetical protein
VGGGDEGNSGGASANSGAGGTITAGVGVSKIHSFFIGGGGDDMEEEWPLEELLA